MSPATAPAGLLPLILLLTGSCASSAAAEPSAGELAPFPYTPAEIRRANPPRTVLVYRMEGVGNSFIQTMSFLPSRGSEKATIQVKRMNAKGSLLARPETTTQTWEELRDHASFPAALTSRTKESVDTPAGRFDCWLYTIRRDQAGVPTIARFWFAFNRPGPPVIYETEQHGVITSRMVLLECRRP